ncbi:MAG: hypothetical protein AB8G05_24360 [Oligoflexales bacterium]
MNSIETLKNDFVETTKFFNKFEVEFQKSKKCIQKWKAYNEFKRELNLYSPSFDITEIIKKINASCWENEIYDIEFLSILNSIRKCKNNLAVQNSKQICA